MYSLNKQLATASFLALMLAAANPVTGQESPGPQSEGDEAELRQIIEELQSRIEALERRSPSNRPGQAQQPSIPGDERVSGQDQAPPAREDRTPSSRAPGRVMVEPEEAERALERSLVQVGGLLLRPGRVELEPSLSYARQENATPAVIRRNGNTFIGQREREIDRIAARAVMRLGLGFDSQLELGLPYRWRSIKDVREVDFSPVDTDSARGSGAGDLRIGLARTLLRENRWWPDLIARATWDTRTSSGRDDGVQIASDFNELQTSVTAIKREAPLVFFGSLAYEHVFEHDDVQPGAAITPSVGAFLALSPETSMRFRVNATFREETDVSGHRAEGSDETAASFTVGVSSLVAEGMLFNFSVGMGLTEDADEFFVQMAVPVRF